MRRLVERQKTICSFSYGIQIRLIKARLLVLVGGVLGRLLPVLEYPVLVLGQLQARQVLLHRHQLPLVVRIVQRLLQ